MIMMNRQQAAASARSLMNTQTHTKTNARTRNASRKTHLVCSFLRAIAIAIQFNNEGMGKDVCSLGNVSILCIERDQSMNK